MEHEICRREVSRAHSSKGVSFKWPIILSLIWIGISFMVNVIIGLSVAGDVWHMFECGGLYWIGFGNMILGAVLAIIFIFLHLLLKPSAYSERIELVLTNKRIYYKITTTDRVNNDSYLLDKITYYSFSHGNTFKVNKGALKFSTATNTAEFVVDEEFYNEFVNAVNATIDSAIVAAE